MHTYHNLSWITLAIPPLFWAGNVAVGRAVNAQIPPLALALSRHVIALIAFMPFGWSVMRRDIHVYWRFRWQLVRLSLSGMVAFNVFVYLGLHHASATDGQLLNSTVPVLIILLSALFPYHRLNVLQGCGVALSCSGVIMIIFRGDLSRLLNLEFSQGDLIIFGGMASFALFSIWLRTFPQEVDRLGLLGAQLGIAVVVLTPLAICESWLGYRTRWTITGMAAMVYVGIGAGLLANLLYINGIARFGPARASLFIHLVPLYGVFISIILLGERFRTYHAVGMAAIIGGLILSQRSSRSSRH